MGALRAVLCLAAIGSAALENAAGPAGDGRTVAVDEEAAAAALVDEPHASSPLRQTASDADADGSDQSSTRDPIAVERTLLRAEDFFEGEKWIGRKVLYDDGSTFETRLHGNVTSRFINGTTETGFEKNGNMWIETTHEVRDGEKPYLEYFFAVAGFGQGWLKEVRWPRKLPGQDLDTYHFDADDIPRLSALFRAGGRAALAAVAGVLQGTFGLILILAVVSGLFSFLGVGLTTVIGLGYAGFRIYQAGWLGSIHNTGGALITAGWYLHMFFFGTLVSPFFKDSQGEGWQEKEGRSFLYTVLVLATVAAYDWLADAGAAGRFFARELSPDAVAEITSYGWPPLTGQLLCRAACSLAGVWFMLTRLARRYRSALCKAPRRVADVITCAALVTGYLALGQLGIYVSVSTITFTAFRPSFRVIGGLVVAAAICGPVLAFFAVGPNASELLVMLDDQLIGCSWLRGLVAKAGA